MLPSGPDLVQIAYSTRSPAQKSLSFASPFSKPYLMAWQRVLVFLLRIKSLYLHHSSFLLRLRYRIQIVQIGVGEEFREDFDGVFPVLGHSGGGIEAEAGAVTFSKSVENHRIVFD